MTKIFQPVSGPDYARMLDQAGVGVISISNTGTMEHVNRAAMEMFGYSADQMLAQNVSILMPEFHAQRHDGYLEHHLTTGDTRIIGKGRRVEGLKADGNVFPMHLSVGRHDEDGRTWFTGILHDLSEHERDREKALRLGRIIEESINEIYVFSPKSLKFSLVNRGALQNLGYELDEMLALSPVDLKEEFSETEFRTLIAPLVAGETDRIAFQSSHTRKDGSHYDIDVVLHQSEAVTPAEIVAIIVDCTERNRMLEAVQQSQKMESIGQLTGGIAHDFNNLLTVITGNLELLEMTTNDDSDLELIGEARAASSRGADLTARLLSFARRSALAPERLNLNDVVLDLSDLLTRSVGERILFDTILSPDIWPVKIDQSQIDSALLNLAINARDAMPDGGTLLMETSNRSLSPSDAALLNLPAGNYVQIRVSDTGTGIDPEHLNSVFEPFFTTKQKSQGHGLGLSMVYGFARQSGGYVGVTSVPDEGTCFTMLLPRDWSETNNERIPDNIQENTIPAAVVLLVEDDDGVRKLTARRFLRMGHQVVEAINAADALTIYRSRKDIDLVFTDMVMPGKMSGWDLAHQIQERDPNIPIIISSGYSEQLQWVNSSDGDSMFMLPKPYTLDELNSVLGKALLSSSKAQFR